MTENYGKKFEDHVRQSFEKVPDTSIVRLHDQTTGYRGSSNHCDFIVYRKPYEYHIECKSTHENTLSISSIPKPDKHGNLHGFYGAITDAQWEGLLEKSKIQGIIAGVMCWWIDRDVTGFIPIQELQRCRDTGRKSIRFDDGLYSYIQFYPIGGKKKRVFFDYDMCQFLHTIEEERSIT